MSGPPHGPWLAADSHVCGPFLIADQVGRAAELLAHLRAPGPHHLGLDHPTFTTHMPTAALHAPSAPLLRPPGSIARRWRWNHHEQPGS